MLGDMTVDLRVARERSTASRSSALHAEGFGHPTCSTTTGWGQVERQAASAGSAPRDGDELVGFVNVPWDGATHAFILDTLVSPDARVDGDRDAAGRARRDRGSSRGLRVAACRLRGRAEHVLHRVVRLQADAGRLIQLYGYTASVEVVGEHEALARRSTTPRVRCPRRSPRAATTSSGRPVPSSGWNRVRDARRPRAGRPRPRRRSAGAAGRTRRSRRPWRAGAAPRRREQLAPRPRGDLDRRGALPARPGSRPPRPGRPVADRRARRPRARPGASPPAVAVSASRTRQRRPALGQDDVDELGVRRPSRPAAAPRTRSAAATARHRSRRPGSPAASIAASHASASSRCGCSRRTRARATTSRQRWRGSARSRRIGEARTRLVVCPTMDEPDRSAQTVSPPGGPTPDAPPDAAPPDGSPPSRRRRPLGRGPAAAALRRSGQRGRGARGSRRSRRGSRSSSRRRSSSGCCSGWRATPSGRSSSACCSSTCSTRRSAGSSARGMRRTLAILLVYVVAIVGLHRVPEPHADAAHQRAAPVHRRTSRRSPTQLQAQLERLSEIYARLQLPGAVREWIDCDHRRHRPGRRRGAPAFDLSCFLPVLTGAGSLIGAIFGYLILPVWVFYLLKDRVALTAQFDRSAAAGLAVRRLGGPAHRRARLRPVGPRPARPRAHGRRLHVHRPDAC